jgi:ADP-ribose pyrophosphatase YjhB (NUDIX family)
MSKVAEERDFLGVFGVSWREGAVLLGENRRSLLPGGPKLRVFDLPGGEVEDGETLEEALVREWKEETGCAVRVGEFLFFQEGVRRVLGKRAYVWRSFFFEVEPQGEPFPESELQSLLWCPSKELKKILLAPYHKSFLDYLENGKPFQKGIWGS